MKIKDLLKDTINRLNKIEIQEAANKARRLLAFTLNVSKEYLIIHNEDEIEPNKLEVYNKYIEQIIEGFPIQYIIGKQEFMGINFFVNENVLIPQPDTEILVEKVLEILKNYTEPKVLDLCTGSGAIAISISKYANKAQVFASDISKAALEVAKINDKYNQVKFIYSNLFQNIQEKFDVIVSNPPYIKTDEIKTLDKDVQNEPHLALDGGKDGLDFYKLIIEQAHKYLKKDGYLCLEIGDDQKNNIVSLIKNNGHYTQIKTFKDLSKNDRVIISKVKK